MSATRTEWLHRSILIAAGVATALLLAEIGLRVGGIEYPVFSRPDDDRGWVLRPEARGHYASEGGAFVAINRAGLRDRDHARQKPPGTLRIAVLGDSYAEAAEVSLNETFWSVLEADLNRSLRGRGRQVEVINFGVRGYGSLQELLTLECCVWDYSPDLVLLAFLSGNDVSDNSPTLDRGTTRYARPYLLPTSAGWTVDRSFRRDWRFRTAKLVAPLVARSRVLQLVIHAQHVLLHRRSSSRATARGAQVGTELGIDFRIYLDAEDGPWSEAWRATEALLTTMARQVSGHRARFAVVCVSNPIQVYPDTAVRDRFARHLGVNDLLRPGRRIGALGKRAGFPVLDLTPELQAYADLHRVFLHGSGRSAPGVGHWNSLGHRVAGQAIAAWMAGWIADSTVLASGRRGP